MEVYEDTNEILNIEKSLELPIYPKRDVSLIKGNGSIVIDSNGNSYLDCVAGIGVANIGHCNPKVIDAIYKQSQQLITCPEIFGNDKRADLLQILDEITPENLSKIYLCNSGTEAVEAAIKFAKITTGKHEFIAMMRGFHGRTSGSLSASFSKKYKKPFEPLLPGFSFVPLNNIKKLKNTKTANTAAIILEIVQGNGGVHVAEKEFIFQVREFCDKEDILLIIDEIQTGFCRTGTMFAFEQFEIVPDILCIGKAIAGGFPMAATIVNNKVKIGKNLHGSTFGGNPLAAAAGFAAIQFMLEANLANQAKEKGKYLVNKLKDLNIKEIRNIRHLGLIIGIELRTRVYQYLKTLMKNGLLALPAGSTVIRLLPPITTTYEQLDEIVNIFSNVFSD